jgi:hypothetical protein
MSVHAFYRRAVWLPIALPSLVAALFHGLGLGPTGSEILTLLLASLVYGGLPYAPIALFATFWIDGRPEAEIRRRAVRAPFWMIVSFLIFLRRPCDCQQATDHAGGRVRAWCDSKSCAWLSLRRHRLRYARWPIRPLRACRTVNEMALVRSN